VTISVLLINDDRRVNDILAAVLKAWKKHRVQVQTTDFGFRGTGTMKEAIETADICLVGLERQYKWGRCAEGVSVALTLFRLGKKVLLLSGEDHSKQLNLWFYWDFAASYFITDAIVQCLSRPVPSSEDYAPLTTYFRPRLEMPASH